MVTRRLEKSSGLAASLSRRSAYPLTAAICRSRMPLSSSTRRAELARSVLRSSCCTRRARKGAVGVAFDAEVVRELAEARGDQLEQLDGVRFEPRAADVEKEPLGLLDQLDPQAILGES